MAILILGEAPEQQLLLFEALSEAAESRHRSLPFLHKAGLNLLFFLSDNILCVAKCLELSLASLPNRWVSGARR